MTDFEEFESWKATKYEPRIVIVQSPEKNSVSDSKHKEESGTEMSVLVEQPHSEPSLATTSAENVRDQIDRMARDATFLNLTSTRPPATIAWRDILFQGWKAIAFAIPFSVRV